MPSSADLGGAWKCVVPAQPNQLVGSIFIDELVDSGLRQVLEHGAAGSGSYLVVNGRASGESGKEPPELAVNDFLEACGDLALYGIDVRPWLPSDDELVARLRASTDRVISHERAGGRFTNTFLVLNFPLIRFIGVISYGTGMKLNEAYEQPAIQRLCEILEEYVVGLLWSKKYDRPGRRSGSFGDIRVRLEEMPHRLGSLPYLGEADSLEGPLLCTDKVLDEFEARGREAQADAKRIKVSTRRGMRRGTGSRMELGRVRCGVAVLPPPGLVTLRLRDENGGPGPYTLFLDSPSVLPAPDQVVYGLPEAVDAKGEPIDQVALVRWALKHLGHRDWSREKVGRHLIAHGFQTEGLRRLAGRDKTHGLDASGRAHHVVTSLLNALELYRTGIWRVPLGVKGQPDVVITDVFPVDAPWADESDFARIDAWLALNRARFAASARMPFSGCSVTVDGQHAKLVGFPAVKNGYPAYGYHVTDKQSRRSLDVGQLRLPAAGLGAVLLECVSEADEQLLLRHLGPVAGASPAAQHEAEVITRSQEIAQLEAVQKARLAQLTGFDENNRAVEMLSGPAAREQVSKAFENDAVRLATLKTDRDNLAHAGAAASTDAVTGIALDEFVSFALSLGDVDDARYRHDIASALDLDIRTEPIEVRGRAGVAHHLQGALLLDRTDPVVLPVSGTVYVGPPARLPGEVWDLVEQLRAGRPISDSQRPTTNGFAPLVHQALGCPPGRRSAVMAIDDSRILRTVMATCHPPLPETTPRPRRDMCLTLDPPLLADAALAESRLPEAAAQLGEPLNFVTAVWRVRREPTRLGAWLTSRIADVQGRAYALAAVDGAVHRGDERLAAESWYCLADALRAQGWTRDGVRLTPPPCRTCHRRLWLPNRLREVAHAICAHCRHDMDGVRWDEAYDRYLVGGEAWHLFAPQLAQTHALPAGPLLRSRTEQERDRANRELLRRPRLHTPATVATIASQYTSGMKVKKLTAEHRITTAQLYRILSGAGVPLRRPRGPRKRKEEASA